MQSGNIPEITPSPIANSDPPRNSDAGRYWHVLAVLATYAVVTLIVTYPLVLHLTTRIIGSNVDEGTFVWNTWWVKYSLIDRHMNPFSVNMLFYPLGMSTALYTVAWLNGFLSLPLTLSVGPIPATNGALLFAFVLNALAVYLLARDCLARSGKRGRTAILASFVAGIIYAFTSYNYIHSIIGEYNQLSGAWIPFTALYFLRTLERPGWRAPFLMALFAVFAVWMEFNFVVYILFFVLTVLAFGAIRRSLVIDRPLLKRLGLAFAVFTVGFAPLGIPIVVETMRSGSPLVLGWGAGDLNVIDLLGPFVPTPFHPLFGEWARHATSQFTFLQFGFVGYSVLVLTAIGAVVGIRRVRSSASRLRWLSGAALWSVVLVVFFIITLGPLLHINGQSVFDLDGLKITFPLPFIIVHYLPFIKSSRYPFRFIVITAIALGVLAAFAWQAILPRIKRRNVQVGLTAAICAVIIFENLAIPLPLNNAKAPLPYEMIAKDPGDFTILQIPLGWRDGFTVIGPERTLVQAYQATHEKRIIGGNTSRAPLQTWNYFTNAPIITSILNYEEGRSEDPAIVAGDKVLAESVLSFLNIRYIVVQGEYVGAPIDKYIQDVLPVDKVAEGTGQDQSTTSHIAWDGKWVDTRTVSTAWVLYKVRPAAGGPPTTIDFGANAAHLHQASGWSYDESMADTSFAWVDGKQATALIRLDQPAAASLSLRVAPFSYEGSPQQTMQVWVNGRRVLTTPLPAGWSDYHVDVAAAWLRSGMNDIRLSFANTASPSKVFGSTDRRNLAAAVDWMRLDPK